MDRREALRRAAVLSGGTLSFSLVTSILSGCTAKPQLNWKPNFHTAEEADAISIISDIILPASESPSASDANVPSFLDMIAQECMTTAEKSAWREGLRKLLDAFKEQKGVTLNIASASVQSEFIQEVDQQAFTSSSALSEYYRIFKNLILVGYFTSESVMKNHLDYHAIPGRYDGCVPHNGQPTYIDNNVEGRIV
ncbi:MAG: gluconate 2-dehydrogenase subunit 3 family protein [Saprospiraceae bacterium]|nr:gluconate 2-dehydrogenase subunit 3 family protein [Saprospiraceae bacterium]